MRSNNILLSCTTILSGVEMFEDHLGYSVVRDRTVGPSRGGPREGVIALLHGVIGAITRSNRAVTRSNRAVTRSNRVSA